MWHLATWFSAEYGDAKVMVPVDDLFQQFYYYMK